MYIVQRKRGNREDYLHVGADDYWFSNINDYSITTFGSLESALSAFKDYEEAEGKENLTKDEYNVLELAVKSSIQIGMPDLAHPYYFTYKAGKGYPYEHGWTKVLAKDENLARDIFEGYYGATIDGHLRCNRFLTEREFKNCRWEPDDYPVCVEIISISRIIRPSSSYEGDSNIFYFIYDGKNSSYPFSSGWTEIVAPNIKTAKWLYSSYYPCVSKQEIDRRLISKNDITSSPCYSKQLNTGCQERFVISKEFRRV